MMRTIRSLFLLVFLTGAFGASVVAVGSIAGSVAEPASTTITSPGPEPQAATAAGGADQDCLDIILTMDGMPPTVQTEADVAVVVAVAKVVAVGDAHWNTPDRQRPPSLTMDHALIVRDISFDVVSGLRGSQKGDGLATTILGGQVGCDSVSTAAAPADVKPGDVYAVFLIDPALVRDTDVAAMWPVVDGVVSTPEDGDVTIAQLSGIVDDNPYEAPPSSDTR